MWNSNGDIIGRTVQLVHQGDMLVSGKIDDHSVVVLVSIGGSITIEGKIDGHSNVTLKADNNVIIGTKGGEGEKKIDGGSNVEVIAGGDITLGSKIDHSTVDFRAHGSISVAGRIDGGSKVHQIADRDISLAGKIDAGSRVEIVSNRGSISIDGKIDGESKVSLTAGAAIDIGKGAQLGDGDRKIDGNSFVVAIAGASISLGGGIYKNATTVDFAAGGSITVRKSISGGPTVRLLSLTKLISVLDGIADSSTTVISWPKGALNASIGDAQVEEKEWLNKAVEQLTPTVARAGYWWENWLHSFGYVAPFRVLPRSLQDISSAVVGSGNSDNPDLTPVKAVGGGWSYTDAALPFQTQAEVDQTSLRLRGEWQRQDVRNVLEGLTSKTLPYKKLAVRPMDLLPQAVARNVAFSTAYDQANLRQVTNSGVQLPASREVRIIDTRSLASSLHCQFDGIRSERTQREIMFHVEAGITMADLQALLDHQHPRLAIQASGGSPGATLAGVLSSATHGGEFKWPLLVDRVRAVHLVGPGGVQWWIEGNIPVADPGKLQKRYPNTRFIGLGWNAIPSLSAQDVLKAVVVSMGTMGVIYSVVLSVVPQFGVHEVAHPTRWADILAVAKATESDLRAADVNANAGVLDVLMDGQRNGTEIPASSNIYVDLAINPINLDCWIVNREVTKTLPDDANSPAPAVGDFLTMLSRALSGMSKDTVLDNKFAGRVFDFLSWGTDLVPNIVNNLQQAGRLAGFVASLPDIPAGLLATGNIQAVLNAINAFNHTDRGHAFLGDVLSGYVHALMNTLPSSEQGKTIGPGRSSNRIGVSYRVGAIGWPEAGIPGRGLEIALDRSNAFTFLQTVLFDDILPAAATRNKPLIGYISIRVCPPTQTLVGMQQYSPYSVMLEVVSYRSPEANEVMDEIQAKTIAWSGSGPKPLVHWGLENDQVTPGFLAASPLGQVYKGAMTRLDAFRQIRQYLKDGNAPVFDNRFSARLGL